MNPSTLEILLQEGEGTLLEYKESLAASFARELVALANTLGGKILLGVRDDGKVVGIGDSNGLRARVQDIARNCDPPVKVLVERVGNVTVTRTAYRIEKLQREEIPEYPMAALREALTNAVMHRDWFNEGANVFVEIYDDRIEIVSPGGLPAGLSASELGSRSVRRNALIADLLHRIAFIEKAGTGIRRMREETRKHGSPAPAFTADGFFTAIFQPLDTRLPEVTGQATGEVTGQPTGQATGQATGEVTGEVFRLIQVLAQGPMTRVEAQTLLELASRANFRDRYLQPGLDAGLIEMTIPENPHSPRQRYLLTPAGRKALEARFSDAAIGATSRVTDQATDQVTGQAAGQVAGEVPGEVFRLIQVLAQGPKTRAEAQALLELASRVNFRDRYLQPGLDAGLIEMTIPDKPSSSKQRYRVTPLGHRVLTNPKS